MSIITAARSENAVPASSFLRCRPGGWGVDTVGGMVGGVAFLLGLIVPSHTQNAIANGETRTLNLQHSHSGESISATFRVNGVYDSAVLEKLNWFLRDWRNNDATKMDPRLFDVVWEVYRTAGAIRPIVVFSAYRSPETNAMLRRRSSGVAKHSQHMAGKAMDTTMPGMSMQRIREIGMQLQRGGVGYYSGSNFVHLDVGNVRSWPRMSYDQLVRLFPDGKTVHLASNGKALPRFEEARAELASRGGIAVASAAPQANGLFSWLFGGGGSRDAVEDEESVGSSPDARDGRVETAGLSPRGSAASGVGDSDTDAVTRTARGRRNRRGAEPNLTVASLEQRNGAAASLTRAVPAPVARPNFEHGEGPTIENMGRDPTSTPRAFVAAMPVPPVRPQDARSRDPRSREALSRDSAPREDTLVARIVADVPEPPRRPERQILVASLDTGAGLDLGGTTTRAASSDVTPEQAPKPELAETISRAVTLPVVITRGSGNDPEDVPTQILAYAPTADFADSRSNARAGSAQQIARKPVPGPQTPTVPGRLDRSSFRGLTGGVATASLVHPALLGPSVAGLRQAARVTSDILSPVPSIGYVATFGQTVDDLDTSSFTGSATKPLAAAPGLVLIMENELRLAQHFGE